MKHNDPLSFQTWLNRDPEKYAALIKVIGETELGVEYGNAAVYELISETPAHDAGVNLQTIESDAWTAWSDYEDALANVGTFRAFLLTSGIRLAAAMRAFADTVREDATFPDKSYDGARAWVQENHKEHLDTLAAAWTLFTLHEIRRVFDQDGENHATRYVRSESGYIEVLACGPTVPTLPDEGHSRTTEGYAVFAGGAGNGHTFFFADPVSARATANLLRTAATVRDVIISKATDVVVNNGLDYRILVVSSTTENR